MLMSPKKKIATIIVGKLGKQEEKPDFVQELGEVSEEIVPQEVESDDSVALEAAAEDIIDAVAKKSPKMLIESMKNLMELLEASEDEEESEEEAE